MIWFGAVRRSIQGGMRPRRRSPAKPSERTLQRIELTVGDIGHIQRPQAPLRHSGRAAQRLVGPPDPPRHAVVGGGQNAVVRVGEDKRAEIDLAEHHARRQRGERPIGPGLETLAAEILLLRPGRRRALGRRQAWPGGMRFKASFMPTARSTGDSTSAAAAAGTIAPRQAISTSQPMAAASVGTPNQNA